MNTKKILAAAFVLLLSSSSAYATLKLVSWECSDKPTGVIQNTKSKEYSYVQVMIPLLKSDGTKVGDAIANVSGLGGNQKWEFEAFQFNVNFDKCGAPKVTGF
ncbi:MAG: FxLYD domain-containing protein [Methylocystis sp.]